MEDSTMTNKIFWIIPALALLTVSCSKELRGVEDIKEEKISGLEVRATLPAEVRSRLGEDGLSLLWEEGDRIALWGSYISTFDNLSQMADNYASTYGIDPDEGFLAAVTQMLQAYSDERTSGILPLTSGAGTTSAKFTSSTPLDQWFSPYHTDSEITWFNAIYPAPDALPEWGFYQHIDPQRDGYSIYVPYIMVNVPTIQDGKSYWKYQILFDSGTTDRAVEGASGYSGMVSKEEISHGNYTLDFSSWRVETSLLEFNVTSSDGADYDVDHIDITMEFQALSGDYVGEWHDDYYALSGTAPLLTIYDDDHNVELASAYSNNFTDSNYRRKGDPEQWDLMSGADNKVTLQFESPLAVGASESETLYAVVIPTMATRNMLVNGQPLKPRMVFKAYDSEDNIILMKRLEMQNDFSYSHGDGTSDYCYPGTQKGHKYSFSVALDPAPVELNATFEGANGNNTSVADLQSHGWWSDADKVALCIDDGNGQYHYETVTMDENGTILLAPALNEARVGYAIYPASAAGEYPPGNVLKDEPFILLKNEYTIDLSQNIGWGENEYPGPMIAVNDSETSNLSFQTVGSVLKLDYTPSSAFLVDGNSTYTLEVFPTNTIFSIDGQPFKAWMDNPPYIQGGSVINSDGEPNQKMIINFTNVPVGTTTLSCYLPVPCTLPNVEGGDVLVGGDGQRR